MRGEKTLTTLTEDGHRISVLTAPPAHSKGVTVILCHGIGGTRDEGGGLFIRTAQQLKSHGLGYARFDFRGHGSSRLDSIQLTLEGEQIDLLAVAQSLINNGSSRLAIISASFSASASARVASSGKFEIEGVAFWNPVVDYDLTFPKPSTPWAEKILASRNDGSLPEGAFAKLPGKEFYISSKLAYEMRKDDTVDTISALPMPVYICHGTEDSKVPVAPCDEVVIRRRRSNKPTKYLKLEGEDHGFRGARSEVINDTISWISSL